MFLNLYHTLFEFSFETRVFCLNTSIKYLFKSFPVYLLEIPKYIKPFSIMNCKYFGILLIKVVQ
jgi:hypothetical protein